MKNNWLAIVATGAILAMSGSAAVAQDSRQQGGQNRTGNTQFDDHTQQVARDWNNQHQKKPPAGLRSQDRLSAEQESRLHEGAVLDKDMRKRVHPVPPDLVRQMPPPPSQHRYVAIGGHIGLIDNSYQVKAVIHLHDNH
jgi:Ni/Co efflux regulator RcnB